MRHQLSYTIPVQALNGSTGVGDVLINYRLQVLEEGPGHPAFSPRVSVILPSGDNDVAAGSHGVQVNLPFSKRRGDWYFHWNGGFTWQRFGDGPALFSPSAAGSVIYRARQMLNLMLESVVVGQADAGRSGERRPHASGSSPHGVAGRARRLERDRRQADHHRRRRAVHAILGCQTTRSLFLYFSYEGPVKGLPRK